jgi:hypothetical protein
MQSTNDVSNFPGQEDMLASFSQFDVNVPMKPVGFHSISFEPHGPGLRVVSIKDAELATKIPVGAQLLACNFTDLANATSDSQAQREIRAASGGRTSVVMKFDVAGDVAVAEGASSMWASSFAGW